MAQATKKVRFIRNALDQRSGVSFTAGAERTLITSVADRHVAAGTAIEIGPEALEEKTVDELRVEADLAGVSLAGVSKKTDIISRISNNYAVEEPPDEEADTPATVAEAAGDTTVRASNDAAYPGGVA